MRKVGFTNYQKNTIRKAVSNLRDGGKRVTLNHPDTLTNNLLLDENSQNQNNPWESGEHGIDLEDGGESFLNYKIDNDQKSKTGGNRSINNIIKVITTENSSSPKYVDSRFKKINVNTLPEIRTNSKKRIRETKLWMNNDKPNNLQVSLQ